MDYRAFYGRHFIIGLLLLILAIWGYPIMVNYFYYGGGWPFVQILYLILLIIGCRRIFRSQIPRLLKHVICWSSLAIAIYVFNSVS